MLYDLKPHRATPTQVPAQSPWGTVDDCTKLADGIYSVGTPSHGGIYLSEERRAQMPKGYRRTAWYEEDCDWAIPAAVFPEPFIAKGISIETIRDALRNWNPVFYAAFYGEPVSADNSLMLKCAAEGQQWAIASLKRKGWQG